MGRTPIMKSPVKKQISLDKSAWDKLHDLANEKEIAVNTLVRMIINEYLKREGGIVL